MKRPSGHRWLDNVGELFQKVIEWAYKQLSSAGDMASLFSRYCLRKVVSSSKGNDELTFSK